MWTWITGERGERDRILNEVLSPLLRRDPDQIAAQVCIGSADQVAELLTSYAEAGCQRVYLWPLGDEPRQLELAAAIAPRLKL
jgi:alkanesulfonate monooxygenase SsuD/methylene tetrahydromethanopterin reductase-like flavin-dependent oxidoreductase (luciferase family)